jgi:hypothetical protein
MRKRTSSGSRGAFSFLLPGALMLSVALIGLAGCGTDPSDQNQILSVTVRVTDGGVVLSEYAGTLSGNSTSWVVKVGSDVELTAVTPIIVISDNASISPGAQPIDFTSGSTTYVVTAENGATKDYTVSVAPYSGYKTLEVKGPKDSNGDYTAYVSPGYTRGDPLDLTGLILVGTWPNGLVQEIADYGVSGNTSVAGIQTITLSVGTDNATFDITVNIPETQSIQIGLPVAFDPVLINAAQTSTVATAHGAQFALSVHGSPDLATVPGTPNGVTTDTTPYPGTSTTVKTLPRELNISVAGYTSPSWKIDGVPYGTSLGENDAGVVGSAYVPNANGTGVLATWNGTKWTYFDSNLSQTVIWSNGGDSYDGTSGWYGSSYYYKLIGSTWYYWNSSNYGNVQTGAGGASGTPIVITPPDGGNDYNDQDDYTAGDNIITIKAEDWAYEQKHTITFTGVKDGVNYSKNITFVVVY